MAIDRPIISRTEGNLLFCFTLAGFALRVINLMASIVFAPPGGTSIAIYDLFEMKEMMSPLYSFIVFLICTPLAWKINKLNSMLSLIPLLLLAIFFDRWFIMTRQLMAYAAIVNPSFEFKTFDFALIGGSLYDALTLLLVNLLIVWNLAILVRIYRSNIRKQIGGRNN